MDQQLQDQIQSNWVKVKDVLCGSSTQLADQLFQSGIIDVNDYEKVHNLQTSLDQVDLMLRKVMQCKKSEKLFEILSTLGYSSLCKEITESASSIPTTYREAESQAVSKEEKTVIDEMRDMKQLFLGKFEKISETLNDVVKMNEFYIDKCKMLENELATLKAAHEFARNEINRLKELAHEKHSENILLKRTLEKTRDEFKETRTNEEIAQRQKVQLKQLQSQYDGQNEQIQRISNDKEKLEESLKGKDREFNDLSIRFDKLKEEKENLKQNKTDRDFSARTTAILSRIEQMMQTHESVLSIVGKQNVKHTRPVRKTPRRKNLI